MGQKRFDQIILKNFISIVLFCSLLIGLLTAFFDIRHTLSHEETIAQESLEQAKINIDKHIEMIEDYLSLTHANSDIQEHSRNTNANLTSIAASATIINDTLFSIDLFKKSIDSMSLFLLDTKGTYTEYSNSTKYSNAVFSSNNVESSDWFTTTLEYKGHTYWFIDTEEGMGSTINASRILYSTDTPSHAIGILRAEISLRKFSQHLSELSFGNQGEAYLMVDDSLYYYDRRSKEAMTISAESIATKEHPLNLILELPISNNWSIVGIIPYQELYKSVFNNLILILVALIVTVIIAFFISMRMSQKISSPIQTLCQSMSRIEPQTKTISDSCLEITQLYDTYKSMLIELEQLIKTREETAIKLKQAELQALQSQINPHFIYNTLESINALVATGEKKDAASMITSLSNFFRSSLNNGNTLIPLDKEINQAISYFQIVKYRYSNSVRLETDISDDLSNLKITKLIIQPFIENSIIHGFKDINYTGVIKLIVRPTPKKILIRIEDNGLGSDTEMLNYLLQQRTLYDDDKPNFYCIQNVYQRLQNKYGDSFKLYYEENSDGGVTVCMEFEIDALKGVD
ncbi:MAG: sensor histidine kinase [Suipraeoptans sp.]